jgi:hypothetical protein
VNSNSDTLKQWRKWWSGGRALSQDEEYKWGFTASGDRGNMRMHSPIYSQLCFFFIHQTNNMAPRLLVSSRFPRSLPSKSHMDSRKHPFKRRQSLDVGGEEHVDGKIEWKWDGGEVAGVEVHRWGR